METDKINSVIGWMELLNISTPLFFGTTVCIVTWLRDAPWSRDYVTPRGHFEEFLIWLEECIFLMPICTQRLIAEWELLVYYCCMQLNGIMKLISYNMEFLTDELIHGTLVYRRRWLTSLFTVHSCIEDADELIHGTLVYRRRWLTSLFMVHSWIEDADWRAYSWYTRV